MKRTVAICAIGLALLAAQPGCDKHPTRPTPIPPTPPTWATTAVQVTGPDRIPPGTTGQLTATAMKSDGTSEDVTARVQWSSDQPDVLSIAPDGRASGRTAGAAVATATLEGPRRFDVTHPVMVVPANTFALSGIVRQTTYPVAGAKVEVVSAGIGDGMSVVTDPRGHFDLFGIAGAVKLRVGKDDYHATFRTFDVSRDRTVEVELEPSDALPVLRGAYLVTFSMAACAKGEDFPRELRTRTYQATVTGEDDRLDVRLSGARFVISSGHGDNFSIGVTPGEYVLDLATYGGNYYYFPSWDVDEQVDDNQTIAIYGTGRATGTTQRLTGELEGGFLLNPFGWDDGARCSGRVAFSMVHQ
jgi:hypothetical protein